MKFFNHTFILLISLGALIPRSDFSQLTKVKELAEHYELHKSEALENGQTIKFIEFVFLHFVEGDDHDHEDSDHEDLPFKQFVSCISLFFATDTWSMTTVDTNDYWIKSIVTTGAAFIEEEFYSTVFHPPLRNLKC